MRILHVSPLYWPSLGGGEQVVQALAERLARDGQTVTVLTTDAVSIERFWSVRGARIPAREANVNGVRVIRVPVSPFPLGRLGVFITRGLAIRVFDPLHLTALVRRIGHWMPHVPQFSSALARLPETFDLVHGFNLSWESTLLAAFEFARDRRRPYVMTPFFHTGELGQSRVRRNYQMSHQLLALRGSRRVIVQTSTEAQALVELGLDPEHIVEVGVGIEPERLLGGNPDRFRAHPQQPDPLVVFIGRVTRDKGAITLVRAMQHLWRAGVQTDCVIAGLVLPDFQRFLQAERPMPRLRVLGPISDDDKRDLLAAADIVAMPSRAESFGLVYLEAWAYAKPVIGARAGGAADVITEGVDGYLIDFDNVRQLAARLQDLMAANSLARQLGEAGRHRLYARYTWDTIYARTLAVYEAAVK